MKVVSTHTGEDLVLYIPDANFFRKRNIPDVKDPYLCHFTQSSALQWLQSLYSDYKISYDPFVKDNTNLVPDNIDGTKVIMLPPYKIFHSYYKSMNPDTLVAMSDWLLWYNPSSRMNLNLLWITVSWNNITNFCVNGTLYRQMCKNDCQPCRQRSVVIDIHDLVKRSGYAYGIFSGILEHIFITGTKVIFHNLIPKLFLKFGH
jgi:hypothetical protein